MNGMRRK